MEKHVIDWMRALAQEFGSVRFIKTDPKTKTTILSLPHTQERSNDEKHSSKDCDHSH